jgi:hypothetical protein
LTAPHAEYLRRIALWDIEIARGERTHALVSNLRLLAAISAAVLAWFGFGRAAILPQWSFIPAAVFLILIVVHARVLNRNERAARAKRLYEHGIARIEDRWSGIGADGARFLDDHPYARDLDLFGPGSLFQLLNVARTEAGEATLADWLKTPASIADATGRQTAVAELRDRIEFREEVAVIAAEARVSRTGSLVRWTSTKPVGFSSTHAWLFAGLALITAVVVPAAFAGWIPGAAAITWVAVQAGITWFWRHQMHEVLSRVDAAAYDLGLLTELLARIERETFTSERMTAIHRVLIVDGERPSRRIARLQKFIAARDALRNEFARPFAMLLLVRIQSAVAIDRWHATYRQALAAWLTAIGEMEALASLATFSFEHPADPFPVLRAGGPVVEATALAHPLIGSAIGVANDLRLGREAPHVLIVSGSNMSGKSTLLRATGVNVVLALAGGTVRAAQMSVSRVAIGATIRVEDSLQEGRSKFYAEILRISGIVRLSREEVPVLFLLDEILHGTNSFDRRIGAEAIVKSLVGAGAIGLVTTHDLALTELTASLGDKAANVHFEDRIEDGKMIFDYRMREGVVEHSNALALMRAIGIDV